jgi:hypothetical protein
MRQETSQKKREKRMPNAKDFSWGTFLGGALIGVFLGAGAYHLKANRTSAKPAAAIVAAADNAIASPEEDADGYVPVFGTCEKVSAGWLASLAGSLDGRKEADNAIEGYTPPADGSVLDRTLMAAMSCHVNGRRVDKAGKAAGKLDLSECRMVTAACTRPAPQAAQ